MSRILIIQFRRNFKKAMFTLVLFLATTIGAVAQGGPGGPGDPGEENPDNGVPLDGGVSLLIAGGISYVAIKMRKQQLKRKAAMQSVEK